jgi:sarcosine oxidase/L-pipecolate oxidase
MIIVFSLIYLFPNLLFYIRCCLCIPHTSVSNLTMSQLPPISILIIGSGAFGLSTAFSLARSPLYSSTKITLVDRSPFPSPDGSSIDTSRIIRADYSDPAYAALGALSQHAWRKQGPQDLGGEGRYTESGLVLVADSGSNGEAYVKGSLENVKLIASESGGLDGVQELHNREAIDAAVGTGGGSGDWGYLNKRSGWADAEAGMRWLRSQVEATNRVTFIHGEVNSLQRTGKIVTGVALKNGTRLHAELTVLATGAWTGSLVDLRGRATATGQVLLYLPLTPAEQARLSNMPVLLNMSTGLFIIPPSKDGSNNLLKVARHAYGYTNPVTIPNPDSPSSGPITVSLPRTTYDTPDVWVPQEGEEDCRKALREMIPSLGDRPFTKARICWYMDTPRADFLITYHPEFEGLFLATGGSGHGYKFLPAIGDKIVDCIGGNPPPEFKDKWAWPKERVENVVTEDGSRGSRTGMILDEEMRKRSKI